jgi:arginase
MTDRRVAIIGAALDLGSGRRGVDMGPSAIRYAGLHERLAALGLIVEDLGNVEVGVPEATDEGDPNARFLEEIKEVSARLAAEVRTVADRGAVPIVLGGDHSVAIGTLGGLAATAGPGGVLWFDAHGDLNTPETSPSGNVHGMPLAAALGLAEETFASEAWRLPALDPDHVALLGLRSLDAGERELVKELGIPAYTMSDFDRRGVEAVVGEALERVAGAAFVHVSLDMDVVDPEAAPGVGTPVRGGLSYREAHLAMELVAEGAELGSIEIVEVNPVLDRENATGRLAVELAASAFGERIL